MPWEHRRAVAAVAQPLLAFAAAVAAVLGPGACASGPPERDCFARFWVRAGDDVHIVGDFTGWDGRGVRPTETKDGWRLARLTLSPGEHGYMLRRGGVLSLDDANPLTTWRDDGTEVSLVIVPDCSHPAIQVEEASSDGGRVTLRGRFLTARDGAPLAPSSIRVETLDGRSLAVAGADPDTGLFSASADLGPGKHTLVAKASDEDGLPAEDARAAVWVKRRMAAWSDGLLYQIVIDRYRGDGGAPLAPPATPGSRAGGTLDGVRAALEAGSFDALGVTALWLSPVYTNPDATRVGRDGHDYEPYHGYWPTDPRAVDPRIGGDGALDAVVAAAHARGISVLLDLVPNHVYEEHPAYRAHRTDGWFHDVCVCGNEACPWSTHIESCAFTDYLPDVRFENRDAMHAATADTMFWNERFDVDGVRIDAVPMMPRAASRRTIAEMRARVSPPDAQFVLGEVYTGPGSAALGSIGWFVGPADLDSAFDFPLMWALHGAVAQGAGGFDDVEALVLDEEDVLPPTRGLLARMLDNHDVARFVTVASGHAGADPWAAPAPQPADEEPYARTALGLAAIFTLAGLPVLYYGDEIGLAGGGDPDNRRIMPADDELSPLQLALRGTTARLSALRACSSALRRGDRVPLVADRWAWSYVRGSGEAHPVVVVLSAKTTAATVELPADTVPAGSWVDALGDEAIAVAEGAPTALAMPPLSFRLLVRADDECRAP